MRTTSSIHTDLIGLEVLAYGRPAKIVDTIQTESGTIYVAVNVKAFNDINLEKNWIPLSQIRKVNSDGSKTAS